MLECERVAGAMKDNAPHVTPSTGMVDVERKNEVKKQFFFEKKNQKTFVYLETLPLRWSWIEKDKSFLVLFFKKELLPSNSPVF